MEQHAETAGLTLRTELTPETRLHRRGRLRARPGLSQPDPERDPGDRAGRPDCRRQRGARRSRAGAHLRHRLRHSAGTARPDLRGLRHHQAPRPRARARHLQKIVEQLGGTISVASEVGKGTTFVLEFPRTRPAACRIGFYGFCRVQQGSTGFDRFKRVRRNQCSGNWSRRSKSKWMGSRYALRFYELKTARGGQRFSCEVAARRRGSDHPRRRLDDESRIEGRSAWRRRPSTAVCSPRGARVAA